MYDFLKSADRLVVGHEVIGILHSRAVHVVSGAAHHEAGHTTAQLFLVRHGTVSGDRRRSSVLLNQRHAAVLGTQRHGWIGRLPGKRGQRTVTRVVEAAQTFERTIGEGVRIITNIESWIDLFFVVNFSVSNINRDTISWLNYIDTCDA